MRIQALSLVLIGLLACAQDVGDVDRTQPNRIRKSVFAGEWYHQKTTFDVPYTAGFTFTGETSELIRVKWDVQERYLIAYRTYDLVENTLAPTQLPDVAFKGAPIAAYAIESHFDVVREYNALTGEETNVISENDFDRPWYEREFIRVDWSKNLVVSFSFLDDQVEQAPIGYFVQDRDDADRLLLAVKGADGGWTDHQDWNEIAALESADYIDLVDTLFATPEVYTEADEYGTYEYPACWFFHATDCEPARIKVRSAFLKIDEAETYEPMVYPDTPIVRTEAGTPLRYNEETKVYDEAGTGEFLRAPYFDKFGYFRVEREHYDRQRELTESGRTFLIGRWGIWADAPACKDGESYARCTVRPIVYHLSPGFPAALVPEARRTVAQWNDALKDVVNQLKYGGAKPLAEVEDVFVLRENDYSAGGARGQRIGDLRYSFLYYVPEPQTVGPLGYGPSAMDPLTGRIVSASAYVYGAALESWSTYAADVVQLINGEIPSDAFLEGEDVRSYVARARGDYLDDGRDRLAEARELARRPSLMRAQDRLRTLGTRRLRLDRGEIRERLSRIEGTGLEERLLNDELVRALVPSARGAGTNLLSGLSPATRRAISPARWGTRGASRARENARRLKLRRSTLELASFADDAVMGYAETLKGQSRDAVRAAILARLFASTAEHEVGHTLGLRHNFAGSTDALNYPDRYWELKGNSPTPLARMSPEQATGRLRDHQYASIMDYSARFHSDILGIGKYDRAAIRFGYGQLVEVFETPPADPLFELYEPATVFADLRHYTSYPKMFGGDMANAQRRRFVPYHELLEARRQGTAGIVEVPYRFCSDEYEGALATCATFDEGADAWEIVDNALTAYESYYIFNSFGRDARNVDPWSHFDRVYGRYFSLIQSQYQQWVYRSYDQYWVWEDLRLDAAKYGIPDVPFDEAIDGGLAGLAAAKEGLNGLARVIQTPEPGAYYEDPDEGVMYNYTYDTGIPLCRPRDPPDSCSDLNVDLGPGKYAFSLYDGDSGYYFYERLKVVGSFYDKLAAIQTLTDPETSFLGVDQDANLTQFAISMYDQFPDEVARLVGGAAVESYGDFAGRRDGNRKFVFRDMFGPKPAASMAPVDPATSFTIELYAAWLGMAFLNLGFDNSFNDLMRIFVDGNGEGLVPAVDDPARIARWTHPRTGRTFVAIRHADPDRYSPGYDLVKRLADFDASGAEPEIKEWYLENGVAIIEGIRGMQELYGKPYF